MKKTRVLLASGFTVTLVLAIASISSNLIVPIAEADSPVSWCYDAQIIDFPFPVCVGPGKGQCMKAQQEDIDAINECRKIKLD